jgi:hypothetical protein
MTGAEITLAISTAITLTALITKGIGDRNRATKKDLEIANAATQKGIDEIKKDLKDKSEKVVYKDECSTWRKGCRERNELIDGGHEAWNVRLEKKVDELIKQFDEFRTLRVQEYEQVKVLLGQIGGNK